ncbi:MAG: class I SAM-dependent RNA methyltransferase [Ruminococcaceae bacterium]|nr:class I SAM-dependent RNA methyltransferase [Oscillospiraceae bacterium]
MNLLMTAPCLLGVEGLVSDELKMMGAQNVRAENARVFFEGDETILARANIWSRFSERILIVLDRFNAVTFEELFQGVKCLPWSEFIGSRDTFPVKGFSINSVLHSVPDCQKIIKKAVVESLKEDYGITWFEETGPVHQIQFSIMNDEVCVMLDTSGASLHKRGYRPASNDAPIRETLAAAMCSLSKLRHYHTLYDPCCGSGTILIEGAMLANNIAPGINRNFDVDRWGFIGESIWMSERERCHDLIKTDTDFCAMGSDVDQNAIDLTMMNAKRAKVDKFFRLETKDIKSFSPSTEKGTLITNPPYGERMLDIKEAEKIYRTMGEKFVSKYGWSYGIISPDEEFEKCFGRKADKRRKLYNGNIKCQYYMFFK